MAASTIIQVKSREPAKEFKGVCEVPNPYWARVGTTVQAHSFLEQACAPEVGRVGIGWDDDRG